MSDYDVIVIGSGAGGLAAALPLAQAGKRVLVCEQHEVPGGWTHSFTLQGYRFSPGVHYIGEVQPGGSLRRVYEGLGVSQDLEFCELNPDGYDHIYLGEERFDFPKGKENLAARLKDRFPQEAAGIDGYLHAVTHLMESLSNMGRVKDLSHLPQAIGATGNVLRWYSRSGQDLLDHYLSDPVLKGVLSGQAGDHGLPPSQVSVFFQAGLTSHYLNGGYYPRGGGFSIPRAFTRALKRAGGELLLNTMVDRILMENGKAIGVRLADGSEIRSRYVISNADPEVTFGKLLGREHLSTRLRRKLDSVKYSGSCLSLFFAVDMDLRAAGLDSGNNWFYASADVDGIYRSGLTDAALTAPTMPGMFLTVTTLKDPSKMHHGHHTCEAFVFVGYEAFQKWAHERSGEHAADYEALKEDLAWRMFQTLEQRVPGISQHVVFWSLATPLTNEHYINATRGNLYGIEKSRRQVGPWAFPVQSEIEGLLMCGASTESHGVAGVTGSGLTAARTILNCRMSELLTQHGPELRVYPAEDITQNGRRSCANGSGGDRARRSIRCQGGSMILPKQRDPRFITVRRGGTPQDADHHLLALWATACAQHVLHLFEERQPHDDRPRRAIEVARAWARGAVTMTQARTAAGHANAAARDLSGAARYAAYAAAQAANVAHVAAHELGAAAYAIKAARAAALTDQAEEAGRLECAWQRAQLPNEIRELVLDDQRLRNDICWFVFEC